MTGQLRVVEKERYEAEKIIAQLNQEHSRLFQIWHGATDSQEAEQILSQVKALDLQIDQAQTKLDELERRERVLAANLLNLP